MITVQQVVTKKQQKQFVEFPLALYKNNPYFVPPLYGDEMAIFKKDYAYNEQADHVYYLAYRDGKVVGRISGIIQKAANKKWKQKRVRFTRFDAIDDQEVANVLFATVEDWAKQQGMEEAVGPLGFSDLEREGLLIEGFDYLSTFEEQYNYPYYQKLIENCGYQKEVDWVESRLKIPQGGLDPRIKNISQRMLEKYNLRFAEEKNMSVFLKKYADKIFAIWDDTYEKIYGTVPFTEKLKKQMLDQFKLLIDKRFVPLIVDKDDNVVAFGIAFPGIGKALQKSGGRLTLPCLLRLLPEIKNPKTLDLGLIGVVDEYKNKGVSSAMLVLMEKMMDYGIEYMETNLNLENNHAIRNMWKYFDAIQHKRRRCFVKTL